MTGFMLLGGVAEPKLVRSGAMPGFFRGDFWPDRPLAVLLLEPLLLELFRELLRLSTACSKRSSPVVST